MMKYTNKSKTNFGFFIKLLVPPILVNIYRHIRQKKYSIRFSGNYASWKSAQLQSQGYDSAIILQKVCDALLKVKSGAAVAERDSVLFDKVPYSFPLLAGLLRIASIKQNRLSVLDFGGSLGSTYFQCRNFLQGMTDLHWSIVEQAAFVDCGKQHFADERLHFYQTIDECTAKHPIDVLVLSCVLQYLPDPHQFLQKVLTYRFRHIIFDRTAFIEASKDRLTVQSVPPSIYSASYPAWFLNEQKFLAHFSDQYTLLTDFESFGYEAVDGIPVKFKGFIFEAK